MTDNVGYAEIMLDYYRVQIPVIMAKEFPNRLQFSPWPNNYFQIDVFFRVHFLHLQRNYRFSLWQCLPSRCFLLINNYCDKTFGKHNLHFAIIIILAIIYLWYTNKHDLFYIIFLLYCMEEWILNVVKQTTDVWIGSVYQIQK